ncbi:CHAD domain-containing protein [bacterium]|nr:CHAD domain-containing protein [bacterium]
MFRTEMLEFFIVHLNSIEHNYMLALEQNDPEGIHDLRVELKRMRAFFNLTESINPDFDARRNFKCFRRISKKTNMLRDTQVQQKLLEAIKTSVKTDAGEYEMFLKTREAENREIFRTLSENNPLIKLQKKKKVINAALKVISPVWAETKVQGRFYNLRNDIILLVNSISSRNIKLHKVRVLAKEMHYCFEIIQQCFFLFPAASDFIENIAKMHKILGKWHDYEVGGAFLKEFLETGGKNIPHEPYKQLNDYMSHEKGELRKAFRPAFDIFKQTALAL